MKLVWRNSVLSVAFVASLLGPQPGISGSPSNGMLRMNSGRPHSIAATTLNEPPEPTLQSLPVVTTQLTDSQVTSDVSTLNALLSPHSGDGKTYGPNQLVYQIDTRINPTNHEVAGHLVVHLHNNLIAPIHTLYFNVWTDAPHFRRAGGYTSISSVSVNGTRSMYSLHGTLLQIPIASQIDTNQSATVSIDFLSKLPHIQDRYGWDGSTLYLGNWFPILAVHDNNGWNTPPYYTDGESFYSLTAAFHLNITAPKNLVMAISGDSAGPATDDGNGLTTVHYRAIGVRDVAVVADPTYHVVSGRIGNIMAYTYYKQTQAAEAPTMESTALKALNSYEGIYGTYPFPSLRVCALPGSWGGMEYPLLVMISTEQQDNLTTHEVVAHEVSHQWFYSMVGVNAYLNEFGKEAFAVFSERRFDNTLDELTNLIPSVGKPTDPVSAFPSSDFPNNITGNMKLGDYENSVYEHGAAALLGLMNKLGPTEFDRLMRAYFQQYQYQVATSTDFVNFVSQYVGKDMTGFFKALGVEPSTTFTASVQPWATIEETENGRNWH